MAWHLFQHLPSSWRGRGNEGSSGLPAGIWEWGNVGIGGAGNAAVQPLGWGRRVRLGWAGGTWPPVASGREWELDPSPWRGLGSVLELTSQTSTASNPLSGLRVCGKRPTSWGGAAAHLEVPGRALSSRFPWKCHHGCGLCPWGQQLLPPCQGGGTLGPPWVFHPCSWDNPCFLRRQRELEAGKGSSWERYLAVGGRTRTRTPPAHSPLSNLCP